jgi:protein ImuB
MRRVVSLFLPHWPTDRVRLHEGPAAGPLVLAARQGSHRLITAASPEAAALGLSPGMAVSQAQAMVPSLCVGEADPAGDAAALRRLAAWCLRLSPLAAPCPPDGVWIDITGCAHLHGGEAALLDRLTQRLAEARLHARAAAADTPGAAHAVARHVVRQNEDGGFGGLGGLRRPIRRPAQSTSPPAFIVAPGGQEAALAGLPVRALRLPPELAEALGRLGFDTIGQLMAAPRPPLTRRFGGSALRLLDQALGRIAEPIEPVLPPELCRVRQGFPEPIATAEDLQRVTAWLAEQLCEKLRRRDQGASRLDLVFTRVDGTQAVVSIGTAAPSRDAAHLRRLLLAQIENIDPGFGVEMAMLSAPLVQRLGARQTLSALTAPQGTDLSGLVDMLSNRLGATRVFRAAPVESDVPERAVRHVPPGTILRAAWPAMLPRPPRLLHPPRPIEAVALLPDQPPVRFTWRRVAHRVRQADGPERVFGEWWRSENEIASVRDYFQVEDEAGQRFWIFREGDGQDAETGGLDWFLHGFFG